MAKRRSNYTVADDLMPERVEVGFTAQGFADGAAHLFAELKRLDLLLRLEVMRLRAARLITEDEFRGLYIADAQADALLDGELPAPNLSPQDEDAAAKTKMLAARIAQMKRETEARVRASERAGVELPLPRLKRKFNLTSFEIECLVICAASELEQKYETLYAYAQNDVTRKRPSVELALRLACAAPAERLAARASFAADGALLKHRLLRLVEDQQDREPTLLARVLKMDQRLVDFLLDADRMDGRLLSFTKRADCARELSELALGQDLKAQLGHAARSLAGAGAVFFFQGPYGVGKRAAAASICAGMARPLLVADLRRALASEPNFALTVSLLRREALLQDAALCLSRFEDLLADDQQTRQHLLLLERELSPAAFPIFLSSEEAWRSSGSWSGSCFLSFEFPLPEFPLRQDLWRRALDKVDQRLRLKLDPDAVAGRFVLSGGQIEDAVRAAVQRLAMQPADRQGISTDDLFAAARDQSNQGLRRLARKVEPVYQWADIVLPPRPFRQLREVCASVKYRHVVYSRWGFDKRLAMGKGLNVLFAGPSGTGKTMAAQILARELQLDLYKIELSSVVSKYIGETEKNLNHIFREAQSSNAMLFFDEADALFGKRSEVKDAHDRYANIEVAYLLQKMEEYEGIVILATNLSKNLDEAFARRMHHTVEFPFPDASYRERIWRGLFPLEAPLAADVDFVFLARQFDFSGGNIRNVALSAAFMAAEEACAIRMEHLILATARELQKLGKLPSRSDFSDYYELIRERG